MSNEQASLPVQWAERYDNVARSAATLPGGYALIIQSVIGLLESNEEGEVSDEITLARLRHLLRAYMQYSTEGTDRQWRQNAQIVTKGHGGRHD